MAISVRLSKEQEATLNELSSETNRPKSYYVKKALDDFLEDRADYYLGIAALENSKGTMSLEELEAKLELSSRNRHRL